jgi:hypothetical protein
MSHLITIVIIPGDTPDDQVEATVARLLAPYEECLEVEPYKRRVDDPQWCDEPLQDEQGWYEMSTSNPKRKWDWWEIGGRWYGGVKGMKGGAIHESMGVIADNTMPVKHLDFKLMAHAIVTLDGEWHEKGKMGWFAVVHDEKADEEWEKEIIEITKNHQDCIMVGVDCHI